MKQYVKYDTQTYQITQYAPQNKGGISNYNLSSNHDMLIADGYSYEDVENGYITGYAPEPIETPYDQLRRSEYPPYADYLDAMVKSAASDETVRLEGQEQLNMYIQSCLAIKAKYPKP